MCSCNSHPSRGRKRYILRSIKIICCCNSHPSRGRKPFLILHANLFNGSCNSHPLRGRKPSLNFIVAIQFPVATHTPYGDGNCNSGYKLSVSQSCNSHPLRGRKRNTTYLIRSHQGCNSHPLRGRKRYIATSSTYRVVATHTPYGDGNNSHINSHARIIWLQLTPLTGTETPE